jgi:hypothetical protein
VTQAHVAKKIGRDQSVVSRNVNAAIDAGYLVNETPGQGRQASLVLGERELPAATVLPTPEDLLAPAMAVEYEHVIRAS